MGRLHARTVSRSAERDARCVLTTIADRHPGRARTLAREFGARAEKDLDAVLSELDAVVVCVPTSSHFALTELLLEHALDVLVEKPLASSVSEGERLAQLAHERGRILQVGHVEWYNCGWRDAVEAAGTPHSIVVERLNPPSLRGLDIDVVADFMLHDLDWISRLLADEIVDLEARGRSVGNDGLDEAEVALRFRGGCEVKLRASRIDPERRRSVRIEGDKGIATADLLTRRLLGAAAPPVPRMDPLEAPWADFMEAIRSRREPESNAGVGVAALRIVDRVRQSIAIGSESLCREDDPTFGG